MIIAQTPRLILRELTPDDAKAMCALNDDPRVMRDLPGPADNSVAAERSRLARYADRTYRTLGFGIWATVLREDERVIGRCGLRRQELDGVDEVELTYQIAFIRWGRGFATEAAAAIRHHAFQTLELPRLIALVPLDNLPSRRVAEKTGLKLERDVPWSGKRFHLFAAGRSAS